MTNTRIIPISSMAVSSKIMLNTMVEAVTMMKRKFSVDEARIDRSHHAVVTIMPMPVIPTSKMVDTTTVINKATMTTTIMISTMTKVHLLLVSISMVKAAMEPSHVGEVMIRRRTPRLSLTLP